MRLVDGWREHWLAPAPLERLALFRIVVAAVALAAFAPEAWRVHAEAEAFAQSPTASAWRPLESLTLLGGAAPSPVVVLLVGCGGGAALACACAGLASRSSAFLGALAHVWLTSAAYSFGRVHHDEVALTFALLALPLSPCGAVLSVDAWLARRRGDHGLVGVVARGAAIPMRLTQWTIAIGYAAAGGAKLVSGGWAWLDGWTLMSAFVEADLPLGRALAAHLWLCRALSIAVIALQVGFPLVLRFPAAACVFLPSAWCFHVVSWFALGTGSYATLWSLYVAFLPLERLSEARRRRVPSGAPREAPQLAQR